MKPHYHIGHQHVEVGVLTFGSFNIKSAWAFCSVTFDFLKNVMVQNLEIYNDCCEILPSYIKHFSRYVLENEASTHFQHAFVTLWNWRPCLNMNIRKTIKDEFRLLKLSVPDSTANYLSSNYIKEMLQKLTQVTKQVAMLPKLKKMSYI